MRTLRHRPGIEWFVPPRRATALLLVSIMSVLVACSQPSEPSTTQPVAAPGPATSMSAPRPASTNATAHACARCPRLPGTWSYASPGCARGRFPALLEHRRVDQCLFAVVMEAYLRGTSTREVGLAGSVLVEAHDDWRVADKRYLSETSLALLTSTDPDTETHAPTAALTA